MSKKVCRNSRVMFGGVDVSDHCYSWKIIGTVGEVYRSVFVFNLDDEFITVTHDPPIRSGRFRAAINDTVMVGGVDVSRWLYDYRLIYRVGEVDQIELHLHTDSEFMSINGMHPWDEMPLSVGDLASGDAYADKVRQTTGTHRKSMLEGGIVDG